MKNLFLASLIFGSLNAVAFDCTQSEAQFIGKIKSTRVERIDQGVRDCFHKLEFSLFNSSMVCPLDVVDASNLELTDFDCQLSEGAEVSGVLILKNGELTIE